MASARFKMSIYLAYEELKRLSASAYYVLEPGELLLSFTKG